MNRKLLVVGVLVGAVFGQQPPKIMIRVEGAYHSPDVPEGSIAAKPKVFYRAADRYCRAEETADPEHGRHRVTIMNGPDFWVINLLAKTAWHGSSPSPSIDCRLPIFVGIPQLVRDKEAKEIGQLEFGREVEFFVSRGAVAEPGPVLLEHETTGYKVQVGTAALTLFLATSTGLPVAVGMKRGDKNEMFLYSQYAVMEFDPKLFAKPVDVKIQEAKP
jgi:hypothetical protein